MHAAYNPEGKTFCPIVFDGLLCWPRTEASSTATIPCPPPSVIGYNNTENSMATKLCLSSGKWYINREKIAWSNYTLCTKIQRSDPATASTNFDLELAKYHGAENSTLLIQAG